MLSYIQHTPIKASKANEGVVTSCQRETFSSFLHTLKHLTVAFYIAYEKAVKKFQNIFFHSPSSADIQFAHMLERGMCFGDCEIRLDICLDSWNHVDNSFLINQTLLVSSIWLTVAIYCYHSLESFKYLFRIKLDQELWICMRDGWDLEKLYLLLNFSKLLERLHALRYLPFCCFRRRLDCLFLSVDSA